jgi:transposase InsO family protein
MPVEGAKEAPKTFTGDPEELEDFLERFDILATGASLTDAEKFKAIRQYIDLKHKRLFQTIDGWSTQNWANFVAALKAMFITSAQLRPFTITTLASLVRRFAQGQIRTEQDVLTYYRDFYTVAKWLEDASKITVEEKNRYFWFGFPTAVRQQLEQYLRIILPAHNRAEPWPMAEVLQAARYIYNDMAFDQVTPLLNLGPPPGLEDLAYNDPLPPIVPPVIRRTMPAPAIESYARRDEDGRQEVITRRVQIPPEKPTKPREDEMEDLIGQLMTLDLGDKQYAVAYAKLTLLAPEVVKEYAKPHQAGLAAHRRAKYPQFRHDGTLSNDSSLPSPTSPPRGRFACYFCGKTAPECFGTKHCLTARKYIEDKKIIQHNGYYLFPDGSRIPQHEKGMQYVVDQFYAQAATSTGSSMIFAIHKKPILQSPPSQGSRHQAYVTEITDDEFAPMEDPPSPKPDPYEGKIYSILPREDSSLAFTRASAKKAVGSQPEKLEQTSQPKSSPSSIPSPNSPSRPNPTSNPQYRFTAKVEEEKLIGSVVNKVLENSIRLDTRELFAVAPEVRRRLVDLLKTTKVPTDGNSSSANPSTRSHTVSSVEASAFPVSKAPRYSSHFREIEVELPNGIKARGIFDTGSEIVAIREDIVLQTMHPINPHLVTRMTSANSSENNLYGCAEHLPLKIGSITCHVQAHVVQDAPFEILLGMPFIEHVRATLHSRDVDGELQWICHIVDPYKEGHHLDVPTFAHTPVHPGTQHSHYLQASPIRFNHSRAVLPWQLLTWSRFKASPIRNPLTLAYKPVAKKVRPVSGVTPEDARIIRKMTFDPLTTLPSLSPTPPSFSPIGRLTQERWNKLELGKDGFLWPEEVKLIAQVLTNNERALAWTQAEMGHFREDWYPPIKIATTNHPVFAKRAIPIPPAILPEIIKIILEKVKSGEYEESNSSYRSPIFVVLKPNGKFRIVHDLQELNGVTIRDAGLPPAVEQFVEYFAGRSILSLFDILVAYGQRALHSSSRDLTTFQTPIGTFRLTALPMGWTNAVPIFQQDVAYLLKDEMAVARNFVDDVPVRGPPTRYELPGGSFETIPENPGIRRFIWEQCHNDNRILHRFACAGVTISGEKMKLCVPETVILGHKCTYEGRVPNDLRVDKILNWPRPTDVTGVRGFLGVCGVVRIFIHHFAHIARPLVDLTRKNAEFIWTEKHEAAMNELKRKITTAPCLRPIDYECKRDVILAVDSSVIAVGYILSQFNEDDRKVPARYGSITWNERESRYSQAKLELFGLYRSLQSCRIYLIGLPRFVVEMDAQYIKGMINSPDIQPSAACNRWIAMIQMFPFELRHVKAIEFKGPDGMSRRPWAEGDLVGEGEEIEKEVDEVLGLGVWAETWYLGRLGEDFSTRREPLTVPANVFNIANPLHNEIEESSAPIPRSPESIAADIEMDTIKKYLETLEKPEDKDQEKFKKWISKTRRFFVRAGQLWRRQSNGQHQLYIPYPSRLSLLIETHDHLGHKGIYSTRRALLDRVWWPFLEADVSWYVKTCHECQLRNTAKIHIDPTLVSPATLFAKVHIDTMLMPKSHGFRYLVQARDSLTSYAEWRALRAENGRTLASFIFEDILCRWGAVLEIVTDNGTAYGAALDLLKDKYSITHIRISSYNSQANGIVERTHRTIRDSLVKACEGNISKWPILAPHIFWADRVTTKKTTGQSPFYMVHGIEPVLPLDIIHATYLVPKLDRPLPTEELIYIRSRQLERREDDLLEIHDRILKSRYASITQFRKDNANRIKDQVFEPGTLVLVRNIRAEHDLGGKHLPRYYGPMIVISASHSHRSYRLAELDGAISKLRFAAFRLVPYYARDPTSIPITMVVDDLRLREVELDDLEDFHGHQHYIIDED